jgi:hypothetical protein
MGSWWGRVTRWPLWAKLLGGVAVVAVLAIFGEVALLAGVVAHRAPSPTAGHTPHPRSTASPTPVTVDVAPSPVSSAPASAIPRLNCSIAVSNFGQSGTGGFVRFPGGAFSPDTASAVQTPTGQSYSLTYVRTLQKWVPVPREWVRPDGRSYAYFDWSSNTLIAVDIPSGRTTTLGTNAGIASYGRYSGVSWQVIDTEQNGVYATQNGYGPLPPPGLWLFDFNGGAQRVAAVDYWQAVGGGAAWGTETPSVPQGAANTLIRLDLRTGARDDWFSSPGLEARVVGFDATGDPVVVGAGPDHTSVFLVTGQNQATTLFTAPAPPPQASPGQEFYVQSVVGDGHGIWLGSSKGIFIYTPAAGWEQASSVAGQLGSGCA